MRRRVFLFALPAVLASSAAKAGDDPFFALLFGAGNSERRKDKSSKKKKAEKHRIYDGMEEVSFNTVEMPGTIVIKTGERALYLVEGEGRAIKYGVAVGKAGFAWSGTARIGHKVEWPTWTPPEEMIDRRPELAEYAEGMPGGPDNPLGARALYLYQGNRDTLYRIHGTNEPWSIGTAASSGCIRMLNEEVIDLYDRVKIGTRVIVL